MVLKRPAKSWTTDSLTVSQLLSSIHDRERGLPDFQRDFVWDPDGATEPLFLVAGGSGIVPLMAMLRLRHAVGSTVPAKLLYSSRTLEDVIYRTELDSVGAEVVQTLTREQPPGWSGYTRRVDFDLLREVAYPPELDPRIFVCGPTNFVEAVAESLVALGHRPGRIRTERFGGK